MWRHLQDGERLTVEGEVQVEDVYKIAGNDGGKKQPPEHLGRRKLVTRAPTTCSGNLRTVASR